MFWQEDKEETEVFQVPRDILDVCYTLECKTLPLDHGWSLSQAVLSQMPWIAEEEQAAIHQIHVAESGNGWYRPNNPDQQLLHLSRRTRMTLRIPEYRLQDARALCGAELDIDGHRLKIGVMKERELSRMTTIFSRYVDLCGEEDEAVFLQHCAEQLRAQGIAIKKMMSGQLHEHKTPQGPRYTRKLMLSDLSVEESVALQQRGFGPGRELGFGIFIPHKGIDAVNKTQKN